MAESEDQKESKRTPKQRQCDVLVKKTVQDWIRDNGMSMKYETYGTLDRFCKDFLSLDNCYKYRMEPNGMPVFIDVVRSRVDEALKGATKVQRECAQANLCYFLSAILDTARRILPPQRKQMQPNYVQPVCLLIIRHWENIHVGAAKLEIPAGVAAAVSVSAAPSKELGPEESGLPQKPKPKRKKPELDEEPMLLPEAAPPKKKVKKPRKPKAPKEDPKEDAKAPKAPKDPKE